MVPAPVGFQCPECVAGAAAQVRQPTTVAGGAIIAKPMVTYSLIGINVAVFLVQFAVGINAVAGDWGMWPAGIAMNGEWWRLGSAAFLHGSFLHIAFNMYVLFALGPTLERILGHYRYLLLYVLAAIGGGVASYLFSDVRTVSVGASGAIFGLMGALVVAGRRLRYDVTQVLVLLGINMVIGFIAPGVDWRAHLGGLVTGAAVAAIMVFPARRHRNAVQVSGIIGVVLILAALTMWRTAQINELLAPASSLFT
ncbi:MAG: rhomboid family intramembrane serine protease [Actinobacteria bacterium]|nr:rhomboid family intramembrane serine protease [Actinomycetota bacterium]